MLEFPRRVCYNCVMLQIKDLTITIKRDLRTIISGFNFVLNDRDKAVIIGEEGNGKSTLLKLIFDSSLVDDYAEYSGEISTMGSRLGYLPQELSEPDKLLPIVDYCGAFPGFYDATPKEIARISRALGMDHNTIYEERTVGTLSGGERVKLRLLLMLIEDPDVLLLDEPTNDIDLETLEWMENFINTCGKSVLFVSHDETLIENTADVIIHLEQVRRKTVPRATVARIPYREYIERRTRGIEYQERQAAREKSEYDAKMEKYRQIYQRVEHEQSSVSRQNPHGGRLLKKKMHAVKSIERRFEREAENMTQAPDVEDAIFLKFSSDCVIPNGKTILDTTLPCGDPLKIVGPDKVCVTGRNGSGKTTFLRRIAAELLPRSDIKCAYMPQNYFDLLPMDIKPIEYLAPSGEHEDITMAMTFLGSVRYTADEMAHDISELSGGQKAKLMFLKMILDGANVLILDEPTRNFSPLSNPVIRSILKEFGGAIIAASHDRRFISEVASRTIAI